MATDSKKPVKPTKGKGPSNEEINSGFHMLRNEQRNLVTKLSEVELDLNEHKIVIETLKDLDGDRKCFRLIGGILCEKTVKEVLPILNSNRDQLTQLAEVLNDQVTKKGTEINEYKEKYNIKLLREQEEIPPTVAEESSEAKTDPAPRNVIAVNHV